MRPISSVWGWGIWLALVPHTPDSLCPGVVCVWFVPPFTMRKAPWSTSKGSSPGLEERRVLW